MNASLFGVIEGVPDTFYKFLVVDFVKDAIWSNSYKIVVFCYFKAFDFWNCNNNIWIPPILLQLCLYIPKSSRHTQSARHHPMRPYYIRRCIRNSINYCRNMRLCLVNLTPRIHDPLLLLRLCRLVVNRHRDSSLAPFERQDCSWVSNIGDIAHVADDEDDNRAGARSVDDSSGFQTEICELFFSFGEPILNCENGVLGERAFSNDELVEVVSKEVCASRATMAVVDAKEGALRPVFFGSGLWFWNAEDDWDSVFVVISNDALICVSAVAID